MDEQKTRQEIEDFLHQPNHAVIACNRPDGAPVSVPTWYLYQDGLVLVNMDSERKRLNYLRQDPRVALSIMDSDGWTTHVSTMGRVVRLVDDANLTDIDRLAHHYLGHAYLKRDCQRVSAWIQPDRWHAWGRLRAGLL